MSGIGNFTFETDSSFDVIKHLLPPLKPEVCEVFRKELKKILTEE